MKKIIIVEDEENLVELLKFRLEANGYEVETASDGLEGLKKIKEIRPDLVILDIMMPRMHGYDVCRNVKRDEQTKDIPIIILTAHVQREDVMKAKECGADSFVEKPFEPEFLLGEIEKYLGKTA